MKTLFLSLIVVSLSLGKLYACSCWGPEQFIFPGTSVQGIVVCVEKQYSQEHGMAVKVINQLSGPVVNDEIKIWGDTGWLCRLYTSGFEDGETYVMRITPLPDTLPDNWSESISPLEATGDYTISSCGLHALSVINGRVTTNWGTIDGQETEMSLTDFKAAMAGYRSIQVSINRDVDRSMITVSLLEEITEAGLIQIWDMRGRVVRQVAIRPEEELLYEISIFDLSEGVYVLKIEAGKYYRTIKLAISHP